MVHMCFLQAEWQCMGAALQAVNECSRCCWAGIFYVYHHVLYTWFLVNTLLDNSYNLPKMGRLHHLLLISHNFPHIY